MRKLIFIGYRAARIRPADLTAHKSVMSYLPLYL
jgi:hypothetical protein